LNRLGPHSCVDKEKQDNICAIVAMGCTLHTAADFVGISRRTVTREIQRNPTFAEALRRARSRGEVKLLRSVHEAAVNEGKYSAAIWLLSHCYRDHYYPKMRGIPAEQVQLLVERLTDTLLDEVRDTVDRDRITVRLKQVAREVGGIVDADKRLGHES
jgi:hypothetical protein